MKWWIFALLGGSLLVFALWSHRQASDAETEATKVANRPDVGSEPGALKVPLGGTVSGSHSRSTTQAGTSSEANPSDDAADHDGHNHDAADQSAASGGDVDEVVLGEAKQKRIWDNEHVTFELETFFGKAFRKAVSDRDADAIVAFFLDQADVSIIPDAGGQSDSAATVSETRADASTVDSADVAALAKHLIETLSPMKEIQRTKLRVLQLETEDEQNWTASILLKFVGVTPDQRPYVVESHHTVGLKFSNDDEIKEGNIVSSWRDDSRSTRHSDNVLMKEVTASAGLDNLPLPDNWTRPVTDRSQYWFQVAVADFNQDDFPDIAVATITGQPLLLQSDGGERFIDITAKMRLKSWDKKHMQSLATWIDIDNDGWPDLLLGDRLYRNVKGKAFLDVTRKSGLKFGHFPMGTAVADYDCDGRTDLYILYQHDEAGQSSEPMPWVGDTKTGTNNQLWRNEGGGRFADVTEESNSGGGLRHSFAAVWHFVDDDPYPDLYIANDFGANVHLRNRRRWDFC